MKIKRAVVFWFSALAACGPELDDSMSSATQDLSAPSFVQQVVATPPSGATTVTLTFTTAQLAGDLNVVAVGWNDTAASVSAISDSTGNTYALAIGPTSGTALRQSIYYAKNIKAGSNTLTVRFDRATAWPDIRALEYRGLDTSAPLDAAAGASGTSATASSGSALTHATNELVFGAGMTFTHFNSAGTGPDLAGRHEVWRHRRRRSCFDRRQRERSGSAQSAATNWVMQVVTFRPAGAPGPTVTLTPSTLDLGSVAVGSSSTIELITVKNSGTSSITLGTKLSTGDFAYGDIGTCTGTLAAGATCTWSIKFSPTASGTRTATLTQTDSARGSPRTVALTGVGVGTQSPPPPPPPPPMGSPLAFPCGAGCNSFYVSPSGSDSTAGSQAAPWKTMTHAVAEATLGSAGVVIHAAAGTYPGTIDIHRGGTSASARLVIRCDAAWSVPSGSGCLVRSGDGFMNWGGNFVDIQGFDVSNPDAEAAIDIVYSGSAVESATGNHVRVLSNYVHDLGQNTYGNAQNATLEGCPSGSAIQGQTSHGHVITDAEVIGNRVEHIGTKSPACNQYHGIYMDGIDAIVENNLVIDTAAFGIHVYDAACGHRVSNNVVVRPGQGGILFKGSNGCTAQA